MDVFTAILDILFLLIAIAFFPAAKDFASTDHLTPPSFDITNPSPANSPLASPVAVPLITVTPDRPSHKRKSVSFSLSSMDDLDPAHLSHQPKRPPTPYVSGPASPSEGKVGDGSVPPTPVMHGKMVVDPMGVQKGWLMP